LAFVSKNDFLPYPEALAIQEKAMQTLTAAIGCDVPASLYSSIT
jgi:hypothetical protein